MLFDQMKAVVLADGRGSGGRLVENPEFRGFSDHWGFRIRACRPYRAQTKGKVERPVRYVRGNFFYGSDFVSDDDLNARARLWLDEVANVRVHGTLGERIDDRFARERPLLGPLAPHPYRPVVPRPEPSETPAPARTGRENPEGRGRAPLAGGLRGRRGEIAVTAPSRRQRIAAQLADLKMPGALESLDEVLARVDGRRVHGGRGDRAAAGGPDRAAQQPRAGDGDALQSSAP